MGSATQVRSVRIERHGNGQSIEIPEEFALPGEEATISRDALGRLVVEVVDMQKRRSLSELVASWTPLRDEDSMPEVEDLPAEPVEF